MDSLSDPWVLAIDFGTSSSVVAARSGARPPEVVEVAGERRVPSTVLVTEAGELLVGRVADELAPATPDRALRAPKSHLGEPHPVIIGGRAYEVVDLVAAVLRRLADSTVTQMGSPPAEVRLSYPATWSGPRRDRLRDAASRAGMAGVALVPEPVAAAVAYAEAAEVSPGGIVAVYDLGAGTFDTTVLRAEGPRWFEILGRPGGDGQLGGDLVDELLFEEVGGKLDARAREQLQLAPDPGWRQAAARLRLEVRRAKEMLSEYPYADVGAALPTGLQLVRVTRSELDRILAPYVAETVEILQRTISDAGVPVGGLDAICLSGGASRTPLVEQMLKQAFPAVRVDRRGDPKANIAIGATIAAFSPGRPSGAAGGPTTLIESQLVLPPSPAAATETANPVQPPPSSAPPPPAAPSTPAAPTLPDPVSPAGPPAAPPSSASPRRRWLLPVAIVAGAALVAGGVLGGVLATGSGPGSPTPTTLAASHVRNTGSGPTTTPRRTTSRTTAPPNTSPPNTSPPTTSPPTTSPPTTTSPPASALATQTQVDAAALTVGDLTAGTTQDSAPPLCGNYPRPAVYKVTAFNVVDDGDQFGALANAVQAYPTATAAEQALAAIPSTAPQCNHVTLTTGTGPTYGNQTYYGYFDDLSVNGSPYNFYVSIVRVGSTLSQVAWLIPNFYPTLEAPGNEMPTVITTLTKITAAKLTSAVE